MDHTCATRTGVGAEMFEVRSKVTSDVEPAGHRDFNVALSAVSARGGMRVQGPPSLRLSSFEALFGARAGSGFESRLQRVFKGGLGVLADDGGVDPYRAAPGITEKRRGRLEGGGCGLAPPR